jgi:hypothetical protein
MFFTHEGFSRSQADHFLYVKQMGEYLLIVIIYVDDLIILTSNVSILKWLKSRLEDEFEMSELGKLHYCLGVEFERDRANHTITMSQSKYMEEVLKRFNMEESLLHIVPFCEGPNEKLEGFAKQKQSAIFAMRHASQLVVHHPSLIYNVPLIIAALLRHIRQTKLCDPLSLCPP